MSPFKAFKFKGNKKGKGQRQTLQKQKMLSVMANWWRVPQNWVCCALLELANQQSSHPTAVIRGAQKGLAAAVAHQWTEHCIPIKLWALHSHVRVVSLKIWCARCSTKPTILCKNSHHEWPVKAATKLDFYLCPPPPTTTAKIDEANVPIMWAKKQQR